MNDIILETKRAQLEKAVAILIQNFRKQDPLVLAQEITTYFIDEFYDPDKAIANPWCIEDVKLVREGLTDQQAFKVLQEVYFNFDAEVGINWQVIESCVEELFPLKPTLLLT